MTRQNTELNGFSSPLAILVNQGFDPDWAEKNCQDLLQDISFLQKARLDDNAILGIEEIKQRIVVALAKQDAEFQKIQENIDREFNLVLNNPMKIFSLEGEIYSAVFEKVKLLSDEDFRAGVVLVLLENAKISREQSKTINDLLTTKEEQNKAIDALNVARQEQNNLMSAFEERLKALESIKSENNTLEAPEAQQNFSQEPLPSPSPSDKTKKGFPIGRESLRQLKEIWKYFNPEENDTSEISPRTKKEEPKIINAEIVSDDDNDYRGT